MTSLIDDNGNVLDYDGEDFTITKQAASLTNEFKIRGDVSVNFQFNNNTYNRKTLGYYGPMQVSSPVLIKIPFNLIRNGVKSGIGFIVVTNVLDDVIKAYYVSGNSNWFNDFKFSIQDIDYSRYVTATSIWGSNYPASGTQSDNSGVVFPFVDWGYSHQHRGYYSIVTSSDDETFSDFYPCFYLKDLVKQIFRKTNYKLAGNLLLDNLYNSTIITPDGDLTYSDTYVKERSVRLRVNTDQSIVGGVATVINFTSILASDSFDNVTHLYRGTGFYNLQVTLNINTSISQTYTVTGILFGIQTGFGFFSNKFAGTIAKGVNQGIIINAPTNFLVLAGSTAVLELKQTMRPNDYIYPNPILPNLRALDIMKCIAFRFGCVSTFNEASNTISLNQIDKITAFEDWSSYFVSVEEDYTEGVRNNYIRLQQSEEFDNYNTDNEVRYGETNLETDFNVNQETDLYEDPFGPALDDFGQNPSAILQPFIPVNKYEDADGFSFSSVNNNGGFAEFVGTDFDVRVGSVIRIANDYYLGYATVSAASATAILTRVPFAFTSSGTLYTQNVSYNSPGSRLLVHVPNYPIRNISNDNTISVDFSPSSGSTKTYSSFQYAYFSKPTTGKGVDELKESLSYGYLNLPGYDDIPLDNRYQAVSNMINGPKMRCQFKLPEAVVANFNFDKKIYILTEKFSGYFWVEKIYNYKDSTTEVEVDLLFM